MEHIHPHVEVCPHCKMVDCRCPTALIGLGLGLPALAARYGLGFLAETVGLMKRTAWSCGCCPCGPSCHCGCTCSCHHQKMWPSHHSRYHHREKWYATTDIQLKTRLGETRWVTFLIENNQSHEANITFSAIPLVDAHGRQVSDEFVTFEPPDVILAPCTSARIKARFDIKAPLEPGVAYFTHFNLEGCRAKPISVGIWVLPENVNDFYALCDPCRRRTGHFVKFCHYPYHGHHHHEHCGCHGLWDHHRYWHEKWPCTRLYFGKPAPIQVDQVEHEVGG